MLKQTEIQKYYLHVGIHVDIVILLVAFILQGITKLETKSISAKIKSILKNLTLTSLSSEFYL